MADHAIQVTIGAKDEATKQIKAIDKELAALTKKKQTISVDLSTDDAQKQLEAINADIEKLRSKKAEIVVTAKVDQAVQALDDVASEATRAEAATKALGDALGPELASSADLDRVVAGFQRMGLSLEDITANADRLGSKLREVAGTSGGIDNAFRRAGGGVDELGKSANSSKSALANMIGNTGQDLGQLAGIAGSTGVAIGQMAEYMADAALEGESLSAVAANFAKVALPILAIGLAVGEFQSVLNSLQADEKQAAQTTKELGSAFQSTGDWSLAASKVLRDQADNLEHYTNRITNLGEAINSTFVGKGLSFIPGIGDQFKQVTTDVVAGLEAVGLSQDDLAETTKGNVTFNKQFEQALRDGAAAGKITAAQYRDIDDAVHSYQISVQAAKEEQEKLNLTAASFADTLDNIRLQKDPLEHFTDIWDQLFRAIKDGNNESAAAIANTLATLLHIADPAQVVALAVGAMNDKAKESNKVFDDAGKALEDWADRATKAFTDANQAFIDLGTAQGAFDEMNNVFKEMERGGEAIGAAFDLKNAPLEALNEVKSFQDGLRDLSKFINDPKGLKGKIPNIFDPNDVNAGAFLQKISSMRGDVQQAISDAFVTGGATKAQATADAYVQQFVGALKGKIKAGDVEALWGIDDLTATLKIAVDQKSMAEAQSMLDILTNLTGETAWTAQLKFDLISGNIDANTAKELIARQVKPFGIDVNTNLLAPDDKSRSAAKAAADRWAAAEGNKISMSTIVTAPGVKALTDARNLGQTDMKSVPPLVFPSTVAPPKVNRFDAGGTVGGYGGIAGERGPEILNRRYLVTGPTYVPPGTQVTSRRRTAVILRTRGTAGLRRYDGGGTVPHAPANITINTAVLGNRYDTMRAVAKATRDSERLRGTRG